ncbi:hypothetical protein ELG77_03065 [Rhizobium leguminosarum]|nr:hypothetical protein ELG77_03065 [Rhizobium leguminosarum]
MLSCAAGGTPLCPAGHLPHKGGDRLGGTVSAFIAAPRRRSVVWGSLSHLPISPPVGEMPGRAEGGFPPAERPEWLPD